MFFFNLERVQHCIINSDKAANKEAFPLLSEEVSFFAQHCEKLCVTKQKRQIISWAHPNNTSNSQQDNSDFSNTDKKNRKKLFLKVDYFYLHITYMHKWSLECFKLHTPFWTAKRVRQGKNVFLRKMILLYLTLKNSIWNGDAEKSTGSGAASCNKLVWIVSLENKNQHHHLLIISSSHLHPNLRFFYD